MKTGIKILDAMTTNPVTIEVNSSLQDCAKLMAKRHIGGMIVTDKEELAGILTEQDMVRKVIAKGKDTSKIKVKDIMENVLYRVSPGKDVYEAIALMNEKNVRHLPVVDSGNFVGLLTIKDILKIEPQLFDFVVAKFELKEEGKKPIFHGTGEDGICELCGRFTSKILSIGGSRTCVECK